MITREQFRNGIRLAELVARHELRREYWLIESNTSSPNSNTILRVIDTELARARARLEKDLVALELLPQARLIVRQEHARTEAIEQDTIFGRIYTALAELRDANEGNPPPEFTQPFEDEEDRVYWDKLVKMLKVRGRKKLVRSLVEILLFAKIDITYTALPPVPAKYKYGNQTYTTNSVH